MTATNRMTINGLSADLHLPVAPRGDGVHRLPPCCPVPTYNVAGYQCPDNWMHGSGKAASYFVRVEPGKHLWLDFNNLFSHTHHVAAVVSVQGINPVTNKPCKKLRLEQYREQCPQHKIDFEANRYCPQCKHSWPAQNYMTTVSVPSGLLWIDGWRNGDHGEIRGFLITEEALRGVAAQLIGKKRVFAIGIAFFLSKEPKPAPRPTVMDPNSFQPKYGGGLDYDEGKQWSAPQKFGHAEPWFASAGMNSGTLNVNDTGDSVSYSCDSIPVIKGGHGPTLEKKSMVGLAGIAPSRGLTRGVTRSQPALERAVQTAALPTPVAKKAEIAAGARITQNLDYFDASQPDFYQDSPTGLIYLNYVLPDEFEQIIAHPREQKQTSPLDGLVVGNP
jgi:hypothetical protein